MKPPLVLIIDDESDLRELLSMTLKRMNIASKEAATLSEAKTAIHQERFDLCLTDLSLPDGNGLDLLVYLQDSKPELPVVVITAHASIDTAIQALKTGAFDFLIKPIDIHVLRNVVSSALKLTKPSPSHVSVSEIVGNSDIMKRLRATVSRLARSQAPIYISGPSGVGKELVARHLHYAGPRSDKPFIAVNCGAISRELMESEFFGHQKGSFTGAIRDKIGFFQAANEGTLFLDEVAELPIDMQVKLLRAIQEKAIRPVGSEKEIPVDVRLLSATHRNLNHLVAKQLFREDLYYRINVIEIPVPSLKERPSDIPQLAQHIIAKIAQKMQIKPPILESSSLAILLQYEFPGNIRELENILERAITLCEQGRIRPADLQLPSSHSERILPSSASDIPENSASPTLPLPPNWADQNLEDYLDDIARAAIIRALKDTKGNKTKAARLLGISFRTLRYRLKKLGISESE